MTPSSDPQSAPPDAKRDPKTGSSSVPAHIASRYLVDKDRYHFPDRQVAFTDHGARFTVESSNKAVLTDLVAIAQARGWRGVQVGGTQAFRREVWAAATAAGLEVRGYTPSTLERQAAERARERTSAKAPPAPSKEPRQSDAPSPAQATAEAIRSAATTREELQLKYPQVSEAVFKRLDSHEEFAAAFIKAGLVREADRQQVIALMRERLAEQVARGESLKFPGEQRVRQLIDRAVQRAAADLGAHRAPTAQALPQRQFAAPEQSRGR